ncbi:NifU family protein [Candidatus Manganitrophus noduliformans]|uniref:Iron-sulfur cluster assembly accessory protein n=1 Tax=Candidatus Manganitrophus noduliformans TaxID=2606439 RepID=A0A7X6DTU1_9BACT|nr:NifU family protein [Candidatus Manganitrophus noduliformans]NKE72918.1 iron-sulfur cluster assembly accessory protein [Candidatus Manganitrophus noduliformans]
MIQVTEAARKKIDALTKDQETQKKTKIEGLRLTMKGGATKTEYSLAFVEAGKRKEDDVVSEADGLAFFMEPRDASFLEDVKIDFVTTLDQTGFKVDNPKGAMPAPSADLDNPEAKAIQHLLNTEINPSVASHGGVITLVGVKDHIAYLRLGGGCHGCGSAEVTLKQGVIVAIKKAVPEIVDVLDVTDHAGGKNPYFVAHR